MIKSITEMEIKWERSRRRREWNILDVNHIERGLIWQRVRLSRSSRRWNQICVWHTPTPSTPLLYQPEFSRSRAARIPRNKRMNHKTVWLFDKAMLFSPAANCVSRKKNSGHHLSNTCCLPTSELLKNNIQCCRPPGGAVFLICTAACSRSRHLRPRSFGPAHNPVDTLTSFRVVALPGTPLRPANLTAPCQRFHVYRTEPGRVGGRQCGDWQPRRRLLVYSQLLSRAATLPRLRRRRTV